MGPRPALLDVVELLVDLPQRGLRAGDRGTVIDAYREGAFEIEFVTPSGETVASCPLSPDQVLVVWQSETRSWVPADEQIAAIVARLPKDDEQEVLDFVRFLRARPRASATVPSRLQPSLTDTKT